MPFDPRFIARLIPALLEGAEVTVELSLLTMAICLVGGLPVALARSVRSPLAWLAGGYIQLVRNTPLLIQLYLVYFGLSMAGIPLSGFASGLLALCLQNCGYVAEIYRGGLQSVSLRQFEAGKALGMRRWTLYTTVILPQVVARVIAPLSRPYPSTSRASTSRCRPPGSGSSGFFGRSRLSSAPKIVPTPLPISPGLKMPTVRIVTCA